MATDPSTIAPALPISHIEVTPGTCGGKPRIAGHRIRVQDIVLWTEDGRSADEIVTDFPQLSLADVYAALSYYHDHREQVDQDIREDDEFFEKIKTQVKVSIMDRQKAEGADGGNPIPS